MIRPILRAFGAALLLAFPAIGIGAEEAAGLFSADDGTIPLRQTPRHLLSGDLFPEGRLRGEAPGELPSSAELRSRIAAIDFGQLAAAHSEVAQGRPSNLRLNLFADAEFEAVFERTAPTATGHTLTGRLADDPLSTVVLAVNGDFVSGIVLGSDGMMHDIRTLGAGAALIRSESHANELICAGPVVLSSRGSAEASARPQQMANALDSKSSESGPSDDGSVIDVLVVYAPNNRKIAGGHRAMQATIDRDVAITNKAYRDSGAAQRINLVGAVEVGHAETAADDPRPWDASLSRLDALRVSSEVRALRDSYAADLVLLHTGPYFGRGGIAFIPPFDPGNDYASQGFSIAKSAAFAHELGHNMGLNHERQDDISNEPFPYSHGYRRGSISTIMSTQLSTLNRFSNPRQKYPAKTGVPLGVPGDEPSDSVDGPADAVRSLDGTRRAVANFRASAGRCTYSLSPPPSVLAAAGGEFKIRVETAPGCKWTARSDGGFLSIVKGFEGTGNGEVVYQAPANAAWHREAAILVAAEVYMIAQQGVRSIKPVCERTPFASEAISQATGKPCAEVAAGDLASIGALYWDMGQDAPPQSTVPKPGDFDGMSNLFSLTINWSSTYLGEGVLEPGLFDELPNLRYLTLNHFTSIKPGLFAELSNLRQLDLNGTKKTLIVDADLFSGLSGLRTLLLGENNITTLASDAFSKLPKLRELGLVSSPLTELPQGVFDKLPELEILRLGGNQLAALPRGVFSKLSNLKMLLIERNRITELASSAFNGLSKLKHLYLPGNQLAALPRGAFNGLSELAYLYLSGNRLATLPRGAFDGSPKLAHLDLSGNRLATLAPGAFSGLPELTYLYLPDNRLAALPPGAFDGSTKLAYLDLSGNRLATLPGSLFAGKTRLWELDLSNNRLTTLPRNIFSDAFALHRLDLSSNLLHALPFGLLEGLRFSDYMEFLALEDNPGAPFALAAEFVRPSAAGSASDNPAEIMVEVARGASFSMRIGLSAAGGSLSSDEALIAKGTIKSAPFSVTPAGGGPATVMMGEAMNAASRVIALSRSCAPLDMEGYCYGGFRLTTGPPLVLHGFLDQALSVGDAVKFDLRTAFPASGEKATYAVELSDPDVAEAVIAEGMLTVSATGGGQTTFTVTATDANGLSTMLSFRATVRVPRPPPPRRPPPPSRPSPPPPLPPPPPPSPPPEVVDQIPDLSLAVGDSVRIDLSGKFRDPDGDSLSYAAETSDSAVVTASAEGSVAIITGRAPGLATVTLTARDPDGLSATLSFKATVLAPPEVVDRIPDLSLTVGGSVRIDLSGKFHDPDGGSLSYAAETSDSAVAIASAEGSVAIITGQAPGLATLILTATDSDGLSATLSFKATVLAPPEVVDRIPDLSLAVGGSVRIDLSGKFRDPDGGSLSYAAETSDSAVAIASAEGSVAIITGQAPGLATLILTATDPDGLSATLNFKVKVERPLRSRWGGWRSVLLKLPPSEDGDES